VEEDLDLDLVKVMILALSNGAGAEWGDGVGRRAGVGEGASPW